MIQVFKDDKRKWAETLPLILLAIRTTIKADLNCSPAQLVYGTTLRLPGQFFTPSNNITNLDPTLYADRLQQTMQQLQPFPLREQSTSSYIPKDLDNCTHVFVRHDAVHKPLQAPYDGPYKVIKRTPKHFTLDINGKHKTISIDRIKVAHLDNDLLLPADPALPSSLPIALDAPSSPVSQVPLTTRSGRRVHFPDRYGHPLTF